eukprot:12932113-Prorocentrum_lima.AAC.1
MGIDVLPNLGRTPCRSIYPPKATSTRATWTAIAQRLFLDNPGTDDHVASSAILSITPSHCLHPVAWS